MPSPESTRTKPAFQFVTGGSLSAPSGQRIQIGAQPVTIGRAASADLTLDDRHVSSLHCELRATAQGVELVDLQSTNGTFVGNTRLLRAVLTGPTTIRVGDTQLSFEPNTESELLSASGAEGFGPLVGRAPAMVRLYEILTAVAPTDLSVLIMAETGTGKELVAQALHEASPRKRAPLVVVDCSALPSSLAESILFGHERGSFTGAHTRRDGAFLDARGGTVFLDELGELPDEVQPKLLRAIAAREVKRVGSSRYEPVDVRIVAATRRDLRKEMNAQRFREDLYFRLAQVQIELPPLRERTEDIPALVQRACERINAASVSDRVLSHIETRFKNYDWPGNVRELMNVAGVLAAIGDISRDEVLEHVLPLERTERDRSGPVDVNPAGFVFAKRQFEEQYFRALLQATDGNISEISRRCGLARHQVRAHLRKLGFID